MVEVLPHKFTSLWHDCPAQGHSASALKMVGVERDGSLGVLLGALWVGKDILEEVIETEEVRERERREVRASGGNNLICL